MAVDPQPPQDKPQPPSAPTVDVRALRAFASSATPGSWEYVEPENPTSPDPYEREGRLRGPKPLPLYDSGALEPPDARYIAAFSPATALALLDRLAILEAALLTRTPTRDHGEWIACLVCEGLLATERDGPGCCNLRGHMVGCPLADLITADMASAALGREVASRE